MASTLAERYSSKTTRRILMDETSGWGDEYTDPPLDIELNSFTIPPGIEV